MEIREPNAPYHKSNAFEEDPLAWSETLKETIDSCSHMKILYFLRIDCIGSSKIMKLLIAVRSLNLL